MQFSLTDIEKLARGEHISHESFLAILSCPAALNTLSDLRNLQQLFEDGELPANAPSASANDSVQPPARFPADNTATADPPAGEMRVSFEELAIYMEHGPLDPRRLVDVERFLKASFPEAIAERTARGGGQAPSQPGTAGLRPRMRGESETG